jgi:hypothetical protein
MKIKILLVIGSLISGSLAFADPTPFRAVYKTDYKGLPVSATAIRELKQVSEHRYLFTSTAKSFFISVTEQSLFDWHDRAIPLEYQYSRKGIGKNRNDRMTFDWQNNTATREELDFDVLPGTLDRLLYQLQMREDLNAANDEQWPKMQYEVADRGRTRVYDFEVTGREVITTPLGDIDTVRATRIREDSERVTTFWLAPDYDFLLVRFLQQEGKGGFELLLKEAEFDGEPLTGL